MDINPENQFDFWLGEWDAAWSEDGKGTKAFIQQRTACATSTACIVCPAITRFSKD